MHFAMVLSNLPREIISEILTRLPVNSLLRFKCVSKSWLSLIDSPHFIKSHLNSSIHNNKCTSHRMALTYVFDFQVAIYSCLLDSAMHELSTVKATVIDPPCSGISDFVGWGVSSCNGLICISTFDDCVVLWNPSIRQSRKLQLPDAPPSSYSIHGFGYDELTDDYKLVQIFSDSITSLSACGGEKPVNVYSLRTNSWRSIKVSGLLLPPCAGKFPNGALHWLVLVKKSGLNSLRSISSFDLANETFQSIDLPNFEDTYAICNLGVLGGCLCLCCDCYSQYKLDLWILENGVKESWTKLVSIHYSDYSEGPISPLFVSENGEILLQYGYVSEFMLYNLKDKTFYFPNIRMGCRSRRFHEVEACVYIESLVSPNTGGEGWS